MVDFASNDFLAAVSSADMERLKPHFKMVVLKQGATLFETSAIVTQVYFPVGAIISLVIPLGTGQTIEAHMVGRESSVGATSALLGTPITSRAVVQKAGQCIQCSAAAWRDTCLSSSDATLLSLLHEQRKLRQSQLTLACNTVHRVDARIARWLLNAQDTYGGDLLPFTHEAISAVLGIRRSSVSTVAYLLQTRGAIDYRRGQIKIIDRNYLLNACCECYCVEKPSQQGEIAQAPYLHCATR